MVFLSIKQKKARAKRIRRLSAEAGLVTIKKQKRVVAQRRKAQKVFAGFRGPTRKQRVAAVARKGGKRVGIFLLREGRKKGLKLTKAAARELFGSTAPRKKRRRRRTIRR